MDVLGTEVDRLFCSPTFFLYVEFAFFFFFSFVFVFPHMVLERESEKGRTEEAESGRYKSQCETVELFAVLVLFSSVF